MGPAAQTTQRQKSRTTKIPLMQDWVFRLGSEGLILASTNSQQYDKRLFIELRVQYMLCTQIVLNFETKNQFVYTPSTELSVVILWVS